MILDILLIVAGIIMMFVSIIFSLKIYRIFATRKPWFSFGEKLSKVWSILPVFIMLFFAGYCAYLFFYLYNFAVNYHLLTALVFFFGAVFILIIVLVHHNIFSLMGGRK